MTDLIQRRTLLKGLAVAGLGTAGVFDSLLHPLWARASSNSVPNELAAIANSADGMALRQALAQYIVNDASALRTMAGEALQTGGSSLSTFQVSVLKMVDLALAHPDVLAARVSGTPLTATQKLELVTVRADVFNNAAWQKWRSEGAQLLDQPSTIATDLGIVQSEAAKFPMPSIPASFSGADLTALSDAVTMVNNGSGVVGQVVNLMTLQLNDFVSFIQSQPPDLAAQIIPLSTVVGFVLPNGKPDSSLTSLEVAFLGTVAALGGFAIALLTLPADAVAAAAVLIIAAIVLLALLLIIALTLADSAFADCDHDGDPFDPNEGLEC